MTARRTTALLLTGAAVWLAGCGESTAGTPRAAETTSPTATEQTPTSEPTSTSTGTGNSLADIEPCTLLSDEDKSRLELRNESEKSDNAVRQCRWVSGTGSALYSVGAGIRDSQGLAEVRGKDGPPKPISVGSHDAVEARDTLGEICLVAIAVTDSSRVDVQAIGRDMTKMCEKAHEIGKLVEPKLPKD